MPRGSFTEYESDKPPKATPPANPRSYLGITEWISWAPQNLPLSRKEAIHVLIDQMNRSDVSVSSLGGNSRGFYMIRKGMKQSINRNFFCIGGMGHAYALSYGVSIGFRSGRVICIDGEGSFLMHAGNIALLAGTAPPNLIHVVIYNGVYTSTGNHPVAIERESFVHLAHGLPYEQKFLVDDRQGLEQACNKASNKSTLIIVAVNQSAQSNLPAPAEPPHELKSLFMKSLL